MNEAAAPVIVVSGLPRSGTSLLMQMLEAGGVPPVTDGERAADEDNPRGYLELEAVKRLQQDAAWVPDAAGKAVKVITHLLPHLPATATYRIVLVERDLNEVLASQAKMIARRGQPAPPQDVVRKAFQANLAAFDRLIGPRPEMTATRIAYREVVADPAAAAEQLKEFLDLPLDTAAMAERVDPSLYRNRSEG